MQKRNLYIALVATTASLSFLALAADGASESSELLEVAASEGLWKPTTYLHPLIDDFVADANRVAGGNRASRHAAAARYGLTVAVLDEVIGFLREMEEDRYNEKRFVTLRSRALGIVQRGNRAPITLLLAAGALDELAEGSCGASDVDLLMTGSRNPGADLWLIATSCTSSSAFAIAIDRAVAARPALSYLLMNWTSIDPASDLAATDILLRPNFLARVAPEQRDQVHADVARYKLAKLFALGMLDEALAFGDSLEPSVRKLALAPDTSEIRTTIDGFALTTSPYGESSTADYSAVLALAGRHAEARTVLDLAMSAKKRKEARACLEAMKTNCGVGSDDGIPLEALIVDQLLDDPDADPYVLLEAAATDYSSRAGGVTEALCRLLTQPGEQPKCRSDRETIAANRALDSSTDKDDRALWAAIGRAGGQPFERAKAGYAAKLTSMGLIERPANDPSRLSVDPAPVPFRELPLPAHVSAGQRQEQADRKALAPLPPGYSLVRAERSGERAAAISLSHVFDPNGEVTAGGYWVHLSDDGGKSWKEPLYTGLAEHFPYIVPQRSRLPMLATDRLQLEVEEALIDTASIIYPPVGTRVKRKRRGIYLDIPFADLRKDSDSDGLSDIAERHLLLDRNSASGTPFVVGSDRDCRWAPSDAGPQVQILKQLFRIEARAIITPVGGDAPFGGLRQSIPADKPPIFLRGRPADYRCVAVDRLMIVYSDEDQERLRKFSPDFQLLQLPPIQWNRSRTRGFVTWSMGWAGGTYRVTRAGRDWKLESISEWVT